MTLGGKRRQRKERSQTTFSNVKGHFHVLEDVEETEAKENKGETEKRKFRKKRGEFKTNIGLYPKFLETPSEPTTHCKAKYTPHAHTHTGHSHQTQR